MKNALLVVSGVSMGLMAAMVALASNRSFLPDVHAQAGPGGGSVAQGTSMVLGTGGGSNNVNDLCWVLSKVKPAIGPERTVLALYRSKKQGECFDLEDVRMIDADLRVIEWDGKDHKPGTGIKEVLRKLPKDEQDSILPARRP